MTNDDDNDTIAFLKKVKELKELIHE